MFCHTSNMWCLRISVGTILRILHMDWLRGFFQSLYLTEPKQVTSGFHGLHCLLPESQVPKNLDPETFEGRAHIGMNIKSFSGRFRRVFDPSAQNLNCRVFYYRKAHGISARNSNSCITVIRVFLGSLEPFEAEGAILKSSNPEP